MPIISDIPWIKFDDGTLSISMVPPIATSGWTTQFQLTTRFGGEVPLFTKSNASGYNNVSGINTVNGGQGVFQVAIGTPDTSGLEIQNYAYNFSRLDSGYRTTLSEGYMILSY